MQSDGKTILCRKKLFFGDPCADPGQGDIPGGIGRFVPFNFVFLEQQVSERVHVELLAFDASPQEGGGGIERDEVLEIHGRSLADNDEVVAEFAQDISFFEMHGAKIAISGGNPYLYPGIHRKMPDSKDIFFAVLRAGLWEQDLRLAAAPSREDWLSLLQIARQQAVLGLFYRGMTHLPAEQLPASDLRMRMK